MRKVFLLNLFLLSGTLALSQSFNLIEHQEKREEIKIGTFTIFLKAKLYRETYWAHAIKPRWQNTAGIIINGQEDWIYTDSISDGNLGKVYLYKSEKNDRDYVIVALHRFDDGPAHMIFFTHINGTTKHLGGLVLFEHLSNDLPGYPEESMKISIINDELKLDFLGGYYLYIHDFKEEIIEGPLAFRLIDGEFVLE